MKINSIIKTVCVVAAIGLAACTETTTASYQGPPDVQVPTEVGMERFRTVCLATGGNKRAAVQALTSAGYIHDRKTDIYFSPVYNMSFKLFRSNGTNICSMVMEPRDRVSRVLPAFEKMSSRVITRDAGKSDAGDQYINIVAVSR